MILSVAARVDMDQIWAFSAARWGEDRADRYIAAIQSVIATLADQADRGHPIEEAGPSWLFLKSGRHYVTYRIDSGTVRIARVLHTSMDPRRHLP